MRININKNKNDNFINKNISMKNNDNNYFVQNSLKKFFKNKKF